MCRIGFVEMVSIWWFIALVGALIIQRLFELRLSVRNEQKMKAKGGFECYEDHYWLMILLHSTWFVAILIEVWFFTHDPPKWLVLVAIFGMIAGQVLRLISIRSLGWRWSTRIYVVPHEAPVKHGIYKYFRHPNYYGVILEIAFVPLIHAAYGTALIWSFLNFFFLKYRIRLEESALSNSGEIST